MDLEVREADLGNWLLLHSAIEAAAHALADSRPALKEIEKQRLPVPKVDGVVGKLRRE